MTYDAAAARQNLLDTVAAAIDDLAVALAALGGAYDLLDEHNADLLEEELFRPVQTAYGRAQRTHAAFAERSGLAGRSFAPAVAGRAVPRSAGLRRGGDRGDARRRPDARRPPGLAWRPSRSATRSCARASRRSAR